MSDFVSIIMPVKNNSNFIRKCVESILNQTYKDFEFIIIDDSTDETGEIIRSIKDERIRLFKYEGNISSALNYGIKNAKYEIICRMDGDDFAASERIKLQIEFLNNNPDINIVGTNFYCVDEYDKILYEKKFPENNNEIKFMMPVITSILHPTIMFRKKDIQSIGNYNEDLENTEDLDLFLRASVRLNFHNIQSPLHYYRLYDKKNKLNEINNRLAYKIGFDFLNENKLSLKRNKLIFQKGLLEYYRNDISKAKKYFLSILFSKEFNFFKVFRYLLPSLFGNKIIKYLRMNSITQKLNKNIIKTLNYDTNYIKE